MAKLSDYKKRAKGVLDELPGNFGETIGDFELPSSPRSSERRIKEINPPKGKVEVWMDGRPQMITEERRQELMNIQNELSDVQGQMAKGKARYADTPGGQQWNPNTGKTEPVAGGGMQIENIPAEPPGYAGRTSKDYQNKPEKMAMLVKPHWPEDWGVDPNQWVSSRVMNSVEGVEQGINTIEKFHATQKQAIKLYDHVSTQFNTEEVAVKKQEEGIKAEKIRLSKKKQDAFKEYRSLLDSIYSDRKKINEEKQKSKDDVSIALDPTVTNPLEIRIQDAGKRAMELSKQYGFGRDAVKDPASPTTPKGAPDPVGWIDDGNGIKYIDSTGNVVSAPVEVIAPTQEPKSFQETPKYATISEVKAALRAGKFGDPKSPEAKKKAKQLILAIYSKK